MTNYPVTKIKGIGKLDSKRLAKKGIKTTKDLLKFTKTPKDRKMLAEETGITSEKILNWVNRADLMRIRGVGEIYSNVLELVGVDTVPELAQRNPENLFKAIQEYDASKSKIVIKKPTLKEVKDWVKHSKKLKRILEY